MRIPSLEEMAQIAVVVAMVIVCVKAIPYRVLNMFSFLNPMYTRRRINSLCERVEQLELEKIDANYSINALKKEVSILKLNQKKKK